jgi:hypothetical protein
MIAVWVAGAVVLLGGAVAPLVLAGRRGRRASVVTARDEARSAISQLEWALDRAAPPDGDPTVAEARRCLTLAQAALGGDDETAADFRQASDWAERGLRALGVDAPDGA